MIASHIKNGFLRQSSCILEAVHNSTVHLQEFKSGHKLNEAISPVSARLGSSLAIASKLCLAIWQRAHMRFAAVCCCNQLVHECCTPVMQKCKAVYSC